MENPPTFDPETTRRTDSERRRTVLYVSIAGQVMQGEDRSYVSVQTKLEPAQSQRGFVHM